GSAWLGGFSVGTGGLGQRGSAWLGWVASRARPCRSEVPGGKHLARGRGGGPARGLGSTRPRDRSELGTVGGVDPDPDGAATRHARHDGADRGFKDDRVPADMLSGGVVASKGHGDLAA